MIRFYEDNASYSFLNGTCLPIWNILCSLQKTEKKTQLFPLKKHEIREKETDETMWRIEFSGIFTYMLNIVLPLEGLCLAAG